MSKQAKRARQPASVPSPVAVDGNGQRGNAFFDRRLDLDRLAAEQGVSPVTDFAALLGDFWPEDESVDEFIAAVREWRREGG